jgi:signal peptidase I
MTVVRTSVKWLVRVALCALLALVLGAVTVLLVLPRATHGVALTVLTGSMTPDIPVGSVVIDRPVDPGTLHVGDIATYQKAPGVNEYITHRIVAIDSSTTPTTFTFKGDANRGPDITPVPASAIRGKVWFHVPYLGSLRDTISDSLGRVVLIGIVAAGLGGYAISQFVAAIRERRRKNDPEADDGTDEPAEQPTPDLGCLQVQFSPHAVGDVDPSFVASLLQGECDVVDGIVRLTFVGTDQRLAVLRELLQPHALDAEVISV